MPYPERLRTNLGLGLTKGGGGMGQVSTMETRSNDYYRFDGISYGVFAKDVVIGAGEDFVYKQKFLINTLPTDSFRMFGDLGSFSSRLRIVSDGRVNLRDSASNFDTASGVVTPYIGSLTEIKVTRVANVTSIYLDDNLIGSTETLNDSYEINQLNRNSTTVSDVPGVQSDIYIDVNGQTLVDCPLGQKGSDTQTNRADSSNPLTLQNPDHAENWYEYEAASGYYLGYERWTNQYASTFGESSTIGDDGVRIYSSDGSDSGVSISDSLEFGSVYAVGLTITDITTLGGGIRAGDSAGVDLIFTDLGENSGTFTADATTSMVKRHVGITDITCSSISMREVLNP